MPGAEDRERVRREIRTVLDGDRARDALLPRADYQNRYPGFWDVVAEEYTRFSSTPADSAAGSTLAAPVSDAAPAAGPPGAPPRRIGPYSIVREVGRGGMGVVYLAEDTRIRRRVALKVLPPQFASSETLVRRFRREAEAASRLDHPGLCPVYEADIDGLAPYIAMRFIEGRTLEEQIRAARESGAGPPRDRDAVMAAVRLVERAARALHAAHEAGLVHRDVKPGNIAVTTEGDPVVLDFGLARGDDADARTLTRTGTVLGTPAYMAPEQVRGETSRIDRRTDVYALGATLHEVLTLRLPFEAAGLDAMYRKVLESEPADPRKANPAVPEDLAVVVATALDKDPDRRYATALEFAEDLRRVREWEPIKARPPGLVTRGLRLVRRRQGVAAALVATALAASTVAWVSLRGRIGQTQETLLQAAEELLAEKETEAARLFFSRALAAAESPGSGATPESVSRIATAYLRCLKGLASAAREKGDLAGAVRNLEEALAVEQRTQVIADGSVDAELTIVRVLDAIGRGRSTEGWEYFTSGFRPHWRQRHQEPLLPLVPALRDPNHREHAASVGALAVALSHPAGEEAARWLGTRPDIPASVLPATIPTADAIPQPAVFERFSSALERAAARLALRRGPETGLAFLSTIVNGKGSPRARDLAARALRTAFDLPPPGPGDADGPTATVALALSVEKVPPAEAWRRKVEAGAEAAGRGSAEAAGWLRARTGRHADPAEGWPAWWTGHSGTEPRAILAAALAPAADPAGLDARAVFDLLMAAPPEDRAAWHALLGLVAPEGTVGPAWHPVDAAGQPRDALSETWNAWADALGGVVPPLCRRVSIVHVAEQDWSERPRVVWSRTLEMRTGEPVPVSHRTPLADPPPPPPPFELRIESAQHAMSWSGWRTLRYDPGEYEFEAVIELRRRPGGVDLAWSSIWLPGTIQHQGSLSAPGEWVLTRETSTSIGTGAGQYLVDEAVLARVEPEGPSPPADDLEGWRARLGESIDALAAEARALRAAGAAPGSAEFRTLVERAAAPIAAATVLPPADRTDALADLASSLESATAVPLPVDSLREGVAVVRLLAGDARGLDGLPGDPTQAAKLRTFFREVGPFRIRRLGVHARLALSPVDAVSRMFAPSLDLSRLTPGSAMRLRDAIEAGRVEPTPELLAGIGFWLDASPRKTAAWFVAPPLVLVLLAAAAFAAVPRTPLERRLRPAVLLLLLGPLLWMIQLETRTGFVPVAPVGFGLSAAGAWLLAAAGTGWTRFIAPVSLLVAANAALAGWIDAGRRSGGEFEGIAWLATTVAAMSFPALAASLDRGGRGRRLAVVDAAEIRRRRVRLLQGLSLYVAMILGGFTSKLAPSWDHPSAFALGLLPSAGWLAWMSTVLWRAAGRRAGFPSLAARAWTRVRGRPATA